MRNVGAADSFLAEGALQFCHQIKMNGLNDGFKRPLRRQLARPCDSV
jgi:hypothetical protein